MKILITGGHLSPAMAVIAEIGNKAEVIFVGRKFALDREKSYSLEYQEISKKQIPFYHLNTGRFTRLLNFKLIINFLKLPLGFYYALVILKKTKPDVILSFGGYIVFPICLIGFLINIPVYIHEQTIAPGLSNRLIGIFAKKVFLAFAQAKKYFPHHKTIVTGNPVRKNVLTIIKKPFFLEKNKPVIYFAGGSLGSHSLNKILEKILPTLLIKYKIIHSSGNISEYADYRKLLEIKNNLPEKLRDNYFLKEFFFEQELGFIYSISDLLVGRSGANTFFELIAWKKPAIFIPLPWSRSNEQLSHARLFQQAGTGEIFRQEEDPNDLIILIEKVMKNINDYKKNFKNVELLYQKNAEKIIVQTILSAHYL